MGSDKALLSAIEAQNSSLETQLCTEIGPSNFELLAMCSLQTKVDLEVATKSPTCKYVQNLNQ